MSCIRRFRISQLSPRAPPTDKRGGPPAAFPLRQALSLFSQRAFLRFASRLSRSRKRPGSCSRSYLSRYTHRVAISNRRLIAADHTGVTFRWKNYRIEGPGRYQTMTLSTHEFIRRFLMHVLLGGFHRIRHYGLLASGCRAANIARARELLAVPVRSEQQDASEAQRPTNPACCHDRAPAAA